MRVKGSTNQEGRYSLLLFFERKRTVGDSSCGGRCSQPSDSMCTAVQRLRVNRATSKRLKLKTKNENITHIQNGKEEEVVGNLDCPFNRSL